MDEVRVEEHVLDHDSVGQDPDIALEHSGDRKERGYEHGALAFPTGRCRRHVESRRSPETPAHEDRILGGPAQHVLGEGEDQARGPAHRLLAALPSAEPVPRVLHCQNVHLKYATEPGAEAVADTQVLAVAVEVDDQIPCPCMSEQHGRYRALRGVRPGVV